MYLSGSDAHDSTIFQSPLIGESHLQALCVIRRIPLRLKIKNPRQSIRTLYLRFAMSSTPVSGSSSSCTSSSVPAHLPPTRGGGYLTPHRHFLRRIQAAHFKTRNSAPTILHWSPNKKDLEVWFWCLIFLSHRRGTPAHGFNRPTDSNRQRIAPSELEAHRRTHEFRSPCCLCAADGTHPSGFDSSYIESQIGLVRTHPDHLRQTEYGRYNLNGEYVAVCAQRRCGYLGM